MSRIFSIEPPKKIMRGNYICASKYHLDDLIPLFQDHQSYGGILIDGAGFRLYTINDHETNLVYSDQVTQMRNHNKGGQSAPRFRRLKENKRDRITDFISDQIYEHYWNKENNTPIVKGIIVAGSGDLKSEVIQTDLFQKYFKSLIVSVQNISILNDQTIYEVYKSAKSEIHRHTHQNEKIIFDEIMTIQTITPELLVYGLEEITKSIEDQSIKKIICSINQQQTNQQTNQNERIKTLIEGTKIELIILSKFTDDLDRDYQGMIGVLWYDRHLTTE